MGVFSSELTAVETRAKEDSETGETWHSSVTIEAGCSPRCCVLRFFKGILPRRGRVVALVEVLLLTGAPFILLDTPIKSEAACSRFSISSAPASVAKVATVSSVADVVADLLSVLSDDFGVRNDGVDALLVE